MRRIPISTSCCFCFRLHQGFVNVIYFDIARLFWGSNKKTSKKNIKNYKGLLFALITFTKSDATDVDYAIYSFVLAAIFFQTIYALRSHNKGIPKNDFKIYKKYIISKLLFTFNNFFQMTFQDTLSCEFHPEQKYLDKCFSNSISLKIFLGLLWTAVELYFTYIVFCFYMKTLKGFYGPIGSPPIFPDIYNASQNSRFKTGLALEVFGIKIKGNILKGYDQEGFVLDKNMKVYKNSVKLLKGYDPRETLFHDLTLGLLTKKRMSPTKVHNQLFFQ